LEARFAKVTPLSSGGGEQALAADAPER